MLPLYEAIKLRDIQLVKKYAKTNTINDTSNIYYKTGMTALHYAVCCGYDEAIPILLDAGAEINQVNGNNETAIMLAVMNRNFSCFRLLDSKGALYNQKWVGAAIRSILFSDIRSTNYNSATISNLFDNQLLPKQLGEEALIYTVQNNLLDGVSSLLKCGFSPNLCFNDESLLDIANNYDYHTMAELLTEYGAKTNQQNFYTFWQAAKQFREAAKQDEIVSGFVTNPKAGLIERPGI